MTTITESAAVSRVELELALRAAVLQASPAEHGRERARGVEGVLVRGLGVLAGVVTVVDLRLLLAAG